MKKLTLFFLFFIKIVSAEDIPFVTDKPKIYTYQTNQKIVQLVLDDRLEFSNEMTWRFSLSKKDNVKMIATIILVKAKQTGPGANHDFNSSKIQNDDPLLSHLKALNGVSLELYWDNKLQKITKVTGAEKIITAIEKNQKNNFSASSSLVEAAKKLYNDESLLNLWQNILLLPKNEKEKIKMTPPLTGFYHREWSGNNYFLSSENKSIVSYYKEPAKVEAIINEVKGSGTVLLDTSWHGAKGSLSFTQNIKALSHLIKQRHEISWSVLDEKILLQNGEIKSKQEELDSINKSNDDSIPNEKK